MEAIFSSLATLALAVVVAGLTAYIGAWLFERATRKIDEWAELRQGNTAVGIVLGAIVMGIAIVVQPALESPLISGDVGDKRPYYDLFANGLGLAVALLLSVGAIGLALWLFTKLTADLDEWDELAKGNNSVAILMAGVILAVSLLVTTAVERILVALIDAIFA